MGDASIRARAARLDPDMVLERWDDTAAVTFDRDLWAELTTLRFVEDANNVLILGPVGVGKTFLANALGHVACRRRHSVIAERADRLLKRLRASPLDLSHDTEMRRLMRVDLLLIDDFALHALDAVETADIYEIVVERHRRASTVITSNREPSEWLTLMADLLLAQSAADRLQSAAYELVVDGESYRCQKPLPLNRRSRRSTTGSTEPLDEADRSPSAENSASAHDSPGNVPVGRRTRPRGRRP